MMTRRDVLKWTGAGVLAARLPLLAQDKSPRKIPIGVQLWSVRDAIAKDFDGTLKQIAEMGFEGVEFSGYHKYANDAAGLRKKLDELGLKAAGTHLPAGSFIGDPLQKTIDFHKTIGCSFLIVPGDARFTHPEKSKELAEAMNQAAEALQSEGLFCGYHNHTEEFQKAGDTTFWELFARRTRQDVILQLDVGWAKVAGFDPAELVKSHPGRIRTSHFKAKLPADAKDKKPFIGQDVIDWKSLITACREVGGTEWIIVEQEDYPDGKTPMECTRTSLEGLKKILSDMEK